MTPQEDLKERQLEIEQESIMLGRTRYRGDRPLPWQINGSPAEEASLAPGTELLRKYVEPVAEAIEDFLATAGTSAGRRHTALPYLANVDPLQAAYLAVRTGINGAAAGHTLQHVAEHVGIALQEHLEMLSMQSNHPGLAKKLKRQLARSTSAKHRLGVLRHVREKYALATLGWSRADKILVGTKLLELAAETTPLFMFERRHRGRNKTPQHLVFTPETAEWLEKAHGKCELLSPIHLPMVAPPRPWQNPYVGGYLGSAFRARLVHTRSRGYLDELGGVDLTHVLAAVNAVQATRWRINKSVLDAIEAEMDRGGGSAGLPREHDLPLPPLPPGIPEGVPMRRMTTAQRELMAPWTALAAKVHAENEKAGHDRITLSQKLYIAYRFQDEEAIYFPHYLDFRGRIYPLASYLNPQADDVGRALLEFADGKPLGEDGAFWLAVHLAGLWGVDKVPFKERHQWVLDHEGEIMAAALSPHDDGAFWRAADKPFQALAACFEWLGYRLNGDDHVSHLPIAMDGSCSGLQHFSALLRDPVGGAAVNLVPAERPADVYSLVAERAQVASDGCLGGTFDEMARAWKGKVCRAIAKQPTMTLCYSATKYGMRGQIEAALKKLDEDGPYLPPEIDRYQASIYMADIIWDALQGVVIAAGTAMDWLQRVSEVAVEAGLPIRWTSPIGLPVAQDYREQQAGVIKVYVGGKPMQFRVKSDSSKISKRRQASGIAPNYVHSLDASHLLSTVNLGTSYGLQHFAMIHDSFGVHAADTSLLNAVLREAFVEQYSQPVLAQFRDEIVEQLQVSAPELVEKIPPLPPTYDLDLDAVRDSEFFFA